MRGGVGEKSLRSVLELAGRVADRAAPQDRDAIHKMAGDVGAMADALCELRQNGQVSCQGAVVSWRGELLGVCTGSGDVGPGLCAVAWIVLLCR